MPSVVDRLWYDDSLPARVVRGGLGPLAWAFGAAAAIRGLLYDRGLLAAHRAGVPVVSVGNLRVGGSGKTPFVIWLVERLRERGLRAVVATRGYGAAKASPMVFSTAKEPARRTLEFADHPVRRIHVDDEGRVAGRDAAEADAIADEALLVALRTGQPVVAAVDRLQACRIAELAFAPDVIVLDDGFQHRRLARDVDIVLVAEDDRHARMLPAGPLRESPRALLRADVVVSGARDASGPRLTRRPVGLVRTPASGAPIEPTTVLEGLKVVAVSGIARDGEFLSMLAAAGARVVHHLRFRDHHPYGRGDWEAILSAAAGLDRIVTTEKDLVKIARFGAAEDRLVALRIEVTVEAGDALVDLVVSRMRLDAKHGGPHDREPHDRR